MLPGRTISEFGSSATRYERRDSGSECEGESLCFPFLLRLPPSPVQELCYSCYASHRFPPHSSSLLVFPSAVVCCCGYCSLSFVLLPLSPPSYSSLSFFFVVLHFHLGIHIFLIVVYSSREPSTWGPKGGRPSKPYFYERHEQCEHILSSPQSLT